ncbi:alpha/beta fold hydrolase [Streptomyces sp. NPDC002680]|uniref:alpha/beta fold hydrolase n=1 Tax=Streptomyces sp. NPDC002680 TaxID=3364659 RepID=UPI0036C4E8E1
MATYVLVPGGAHGGWCYQRVARILRAAGHDVHTPTLTGVGERSHLLSNDIDLDLHIHDVVQLLTYEDLHDVILAGHSYGGMVITGVADRATDRIGHLVYLDAATPVDGQSLADISPPQMAAARAQGEIVAGVEVVLQPGLEPIPHYGVTDPDDIAWLTSKLTPHPYKCFDQKLRLQNEAELSRIPQTHIVCTNTIPYRDAALLARARANGRFWDIDTGHDLMITEPEAVATCLLRTAAG